MKFAFHGIQKLKLSIFLNTCAKKFEILFFSARKSRSLDYVFFFESKWKTEKPLKTVGFLAWQEGVGPRIITFVEPRSAWHGGITIDPIKAMFTETISSLL